MELNEIPIPDPSTSQYIFGPKTAFLTVGPPASGKTSLGRKHFKQHEHWSADRLREELSGVLHFHPHIDSAAWKVLGEIIEVQCKNEIPLYIDNTHLDGKSRRRLVKQLHRHGYQVVYIIMTAGYDLPTLLARNKARGTHVSEDYVKISHERFVDLDIGALQREAEAVITDQATLKRASDHNMIRGSDLLEDDFHFITFVGDIHGHQAELKTFLHQHARHFFVFCGDLVDRGYDGLGVLRTVMTYVEEGWGVLVRGNHDNSLLRILKQMRNGEKTTGSPVTIETATRIWDQAPHWEVDRIIEFLEAAPIMLPVRLGKHDILVSHAGVPLRGSRMDDIEAVAQNGYFRKLGMYGMSDASQDEGRRGLTQIYHANPTTSGITQIHGHLNQSEHRIGAFVVPDVVGNTICLESRIEKIGKVGYMTLHTVDGQPRLEGVTGWYPAQ